MKRLPAILRAVALTVLAGGSTPAMQAQVPGGGTDPGDLGREDITVVGTYRPKLEEANPVPWAPSLPPPDSAALPELDYEVPLRLPDVAWSAPSVKPVALGKPTLQPLPNLFAKFGFGTQFTPYVEAAYGSGRSERANYGFRGRYTSSNGQRENQLYSLAEGQLFGKLFAGPVAIGAEAGAQSESAFFYGYDEDTVSFTRDEARQRYFRTGGAVSVSPSAPSGEGLGYEVRAGWQTQTDLDRDRELRLFFESDWRYPIGEDRPDAVTLEAGYEHVGWNGPDPRQRGILRFRPVYRYTERDWAGHGGFALVVDTGRFRFLPDVGFQASLIRDRLIFFAGWEGHVQTQTHRSLVEDNPWLRDSIGFRNSRVEDRYFGFRGEALRRFGYRLKLGQKLVDDLPLFVNDSLEMRRFDVWYTDVTLLVAQAALSWQWDERYRLSGEVTYRRFTDTGDQPRAWHEPCLTGQVGLQVKPLEPLTIQADVVGMGPTWARLADGSETRVRGTADINLGATYAYNRYFTIWAQLNNMAGIRHQRYLNYPSYGFRAMAGLQFSF